MFRLIFFRFLMKREHVPAAILQRKREQEAAVERTAYVDRKPLLPPTENCSLRGLLADTGYVLVDAFCQPAKENPTQMTVHFLFASRNNVEMSEEFAAVAGELEADFEYLCSAAFWGMMTHVNPFFQDGQPVAGERVLAFSLNKRVPRYKQNGEPELRWRRNGAGEKIGEHTVPLWPDYKVRFHEGHLFLDPAGQPDEEE